MSFAGKIWVYELGTGARLQIDSGCCPAWSPDGSELAYSTFSGLGEDRMDIAIKASDGSGDERLLVADAGINWPASWSPDGKWLALHRQERRGPNASIDIWMVAPSGDSGERGASGALTRRTLGRLSIRSVGTLRNLRRALSGSRRARHRVGPRW